MYSVVVAFGLASVMLCIGMAIRAKVQILSAYADAGQCYRRYLRIILMNLVLLQNIRSAV